jgi:hypothetical protein
MKAHLKAICAALVLLSTGQAWAGTLSDYRGTLGSQPIGLTISHPISSWWGDQVPKFGEIHYFYVRHLKNIPLKEVARDGRRLVLEEADASGKPIARLNLEFPDHEHFNRYQSTGPGPVKLDEEEILGSWDSLDGKQNLPVLLVLHHVVRGSNGNRCGLEGARLRHVEDRAKAFRNAVIKNDAVRLKREFGYTMPAGREFRRLVADAVPHDMFCTGGKFHLGQSPVSIDLEGKIGEWR